LNTNFAKSACEWLLATKFVFKTRVPAPTFLMMPFIAFVPGEGRLPPFRELRQGLWEMSQGDREQWLAGKPSCDEL
jgi:hypothetical protein